jgi:hypothetical protein
VEEFGAASRTEGVQTLLQPALELARRVSWSGRPRRRTVGRGFDHARGVKTAPRPSKRRVAREAPLRPVISHR